MSRQGPEVTAYRTQTEGVAARFARIYQRPVILRVRDLSRSFVADGRTHIVLQRVSLEIHRREFICVIGPSGCGKSTFLRIVAGLDRATGGEVLLDDKPVSGPGPDRGMVFQGYTLFPWLTVKRNVMFGLQMTGKSATTQEGEAREWLNMEGLAKF